jgi:RNA polymerase sigma-70 factor (ECF subfamily)
MDGFERTVEIGDLALARDATSAECQNRFTALVQRQSRFVFQVAFSMLRNVHDAEDVVQETFLRLYRSGQWDSIENERAYLARAAWRIAVDRRRKKTTCDLSPDLRDTAADPEHAVLTSDWKSTVHRLIDALPEELRQPLALSTVQAMTSKEIAEAMGIPDVTVRGRLMRARQILKEKLVALGVKRHGT